MKKVRTLKELINHPSIGDVEKEYNDPEMGPDYWAYLKPGWINEEGGTHLFHEWGIKQLLENFNNYLSPCDCEQCVHNLKIESFEKLLKSHDWYYAYSDDNSMYKKGRATEALITKTMLALKKEDPTCDVLVNHLFNTYCPWS